MYHYRNKHTGVTIKTVCKVTGKNWEAVEDPLYTADNVEDPYEDAFDADAEKKTSETGSVEEAPKEASAPKAKTSRKGKK